MPASRCIQMQAGLLPVCVWRVPCQDIQELSRKNDIAISLSMYEDVISVMYFYQFLQIDNIFVRAFVWSIWTQWFSFIFQKKWLPSMYIISLTRMVKSFSEWLDMLKCLATSFSWKCFFNIQPMGIHRYLEGILRFPHILLFTLGAFNWPVLSRFKKCNQCDVTSGCSLVTTLMNGEFCVCAAWMALALKTYPFFYCGG